MNKDYIYFSMGLKIEFRLLENPKDDRNLSIYQFFKICKLGGITVHLLHTRMEERGTQDH